MKFRFSIHPEAKARGAHLPNKKHPSDVGWDIYPVEEFTVLPGQVASFATGLTFVAPPGWYPEVVAKTGNAYKRQVVPAAVVYDPDYRPDPNDPRGSIFSVINLGKEPQTFRLDQAPVQLILRPVCEAMSFEVHHGDIDHNTERGGERYGVADGEPDPFAA
ncbi:MAG: hypothetical protein A2538_00295 [Candidatus Magasanikbacteria bacterium RIFOXYD2_FULL_41_14]|uniref:dUTPase-like domain-containing protein n=1 Tax=Candidatus Magasanikbacteria bacterium RIFOXYD2_FULL_41_14 TaxID=1798709 RepID=A0A1F6PEI7_9BACT|nr:MAG: hypothetical protein A2538_00295 [Candidatus Magasanikbacteria bacterium RIFOXYD2_FULL_41_14]